MKIGRASETNKGKDYAAYRSRFVPACPVVLRLPFGAARFACCVISAGEIL